MNRSATLEELAAKSWDLLVIGGGIVGSGIARDAALRGIKVALIDAHDFAFGTSSRSSRLLHGGIRYLAQGKIGLVREASVEKRTLHRIAPHLAEPMAFCFPAYRGSGWPLWQLKIGVKIYDLLAGRNLAPSRGVGPGEVLKMAPRLKRQGLKGGALYYDGFTNDARLVIDTLRSASKAGAAVANYVRFLAVERNGSELHCRVRDEESKHEFNIKTRAVVNATGPWAQGLGWSDVRLRLTKGIHLILDASRLPTGCAVVITDGPRVIFVLPWDKLTIVGTTDTDFHAPPETVKVEPSDVEYLLRNINEFFPEAKICGEDVLGSYAGVRPLIADPRGKPSDISRAHSICQPEPGWWDVAGGKLTTYRLMAEQTVDQIARFLGGSFGKCETADRPLLPEVETRGISGIVPPQPTRELVEHFIRNEWARGVEDVMARRTSWNLYCPDPQNVRKQVDQWMQGFSAQQ